MQSIDSEMENLNQSLTDMEDNKNPRLISEETQ